MAAERGELLPITLGRAPMQQIYPQPVMLHRVLLAGVS